MNLWYFPLTSTPTLLILTWLLLALPIPSRITLLIYDLASNFLLNFCASRKRNVGIRDIEEDIKKAFPWEGRDWSGLEGMLQN
jgi:hypothetical protein